MSETLTPQQRRILDMIGHEANNIVRLFAEVEQTVEKLNGHVQPAQELALAKMVKGVKRYKRFIEQNFIDELERITHE